MPRVALDLEVPADLAVVKTTGWRIASGLVPGEPNQGLVAEMGDSPARLAEYDDSSWEQDSDIQKRRSVGFTFAWYRIKITIPSEVKGEKIAGGRVWFCHRPHILPPYLSNLRNSAPLRLWPLRIASPMASRLPVPGYYSKLT